MNKVARFLLTGFALSVITIILSLAFTQTAARKTIRHDTAVKALLAQ